VEDGEEVPVLVLMSAVGCCACRPLDLSPASDGLAGRPRLVVGLGGGSGSGDSRLRKEELAVESTSSLLPLLLLLRVVGVCGIIRDVRWTLLWIDRERTTSACVGVLLGYVPLPPAEFVRCTVWMDGWMDGSRVNHSFVCWCVVELCLDGLRAN
jgi:hypothetical protein